MKGRRRPVRRRRASTVGRTVAVLSIALSCLMLFITVVGLVGLNWQKAREDRLWFTIAPTYEANAQIRQSMIEAQSGLRGYLVMMRTDSSTTIARDPYHTDANDFLQPYTAARARIDQDVAAVDQLLARDHTGESSATHNSMDDLAAAQRRTVEAWWKYADKAAANPHLSVEEFSEGLSLFAQFSQVNDGLRDTLAAERTRLIEELSRSANGTATAIIMATVIAIVLAIFLGMRAIRSLTLPLQRLRDAVTRQTNGDRRAWARMDDGAAEVRDLATHLNALSISQHALIDAHATSLALERAEVAATRELRDAGDMASAFQAATRAIGQTLGVDRVICGAVRQGGTFGEGTLWTPDGLRSYSPAPSMSSAICREVGRLWAGERRIVVDDIAESGGVGERISAELSGVFVDGAFIVIPFGLYERPIGVVFVQAEDPRVWSEGEVAFVQHLVSELANHVVQEERAKEQADYVARLEDLDRQKDDFMSTVSHELRTPLTSISGYLELLDDEDDLNPMQRKMLDVVGRNAVRLRGLIEDLLVLNRLEAAVPNSGELVDLSQLVARTAEELLPAANTAEVTLEVDVVPAFVRGDPMQLGRALTNVLSNAVKFTPAQGSVSLRLHTEGDMAVLSCTDTGMGIPKADMDRMFTRFFRASNATAAQVPGTGLGLVIVQGIVAKHGGTLELESEVGVGTTFRMRLPVVDPLVVERTRVEAEVAAQTAAQNRQAMEVVNRVRAIVATGAE